MEEVMETKNEGEELVEEPVRNITMNSVPISTIRDFQLFARAHAYNKYSIALKLLLDRSAVLEILSNIDLRVKTLENRMKVAQLSDAERVESKIPKTFGGKKNE